MGHGHFDVKHQDAHSLLRPEAVESLYVMWKVTGDPQYREWAWTIFRRVRLRGWQPIQREAAAGLTPHSSLLAPLQGVRALGARGRGGPATLPAA